MLNMYRCEHATDETPAGPCPYKEDVADDSTPCQCCEECAQECSDDV